MTDISDRDCPWHNITEKRSLTKQLSKPYKCRAWTWYRWKFPCLTHDTRLWISVREATAVFVYSLDRPANFLQTWQKQYWFQWGGKGTVSDGCKDTNLSWQLSVFDPLPISPCLLLALSATHFAFSNSTRMKWHRTQLYRNWNISIWFYARGILMR